MLVQVQANLKYSMVSIHMIVSVDVGVCANVYVRMCSGGSRVLRAGGEGGEVYLGFRFCIMGSYRLVFFHLG